MIREVTPEEALSLLFSGEYDLWTAKMFREAFPIKLPENPPLCTYCGLLDWTIKQYGRVTHKEACPNRTDPWHQGAPFTCHVDESGGLAEETPAEAAERRGYGH